MLTLQHALFCAFDMLCHARLYKYPMSKLNIKNNQYSFNKCDMFETRAYRQVYYFPTKIPTNLKYSFSDTFSVYLRTYHA